MTDEPTIITFPKAKVEAIFARAVEQILKGGPHSVQVETRHNDGSISVSVHELTEYELPEYELPDELQITDEQVADARDRARKYIEKINQ